MFIMVRIILFLMVFILSLFANQFKSSSKDIYQKNCIECHKKLPVTIDKFFYRYLLKYSSESKVKQKIFEYLKKPTKDQSVMAESFIRRFGVKKPTKLNDEQLKKAIDIYWQNYKVFGKLK